MTETVIESFMKYIITENGQVIMGNHTYHQDLAAKTQGKIIAAGHCELKDGRIRTFGESFGLGIQSIPEDANMIELALGMSPEKIAEIEVASEFHKERQARNTGLSPDDPLL